MDKYWTGLKRHIITVIVGLLTAIPTLHAEDYSLQFSDPLGDATPYIDLTGMNFTFDSESGDYHARFYGQSTTPLSSGVWLDFVLLNLDRSSSSLIMGGTIAPNQEGPNLIFDLFGSRPELTSWQLGDRVASGQFEAPPTTGFVPPGAGNGNTRALKLSEFGISFWYMDDMGIDQSAAIQVVPEPSTLWLAGAGLCAFAIHRRLRRSARSR